MSSENFILLHTRTKSYSIKESGQESGSVNNDIINESQNDTYFDNYDHFLNVEMKVDEIADVTSNTYKRPNLVTDDDVIEKHETMDSPYGKKKTVQHETDVLVALVKKFGLNKMPKGSNRRTEVWIQITEEFNRTTGNNWSHKKLTSKWVNYRRALNAKAIFTFVIGLKRFIHFVISIF